MKKRAAKRLIDLEDKETFIKRLQKRHDYLKSKLPFKAKDSNQMKYLKYQIRKLKGKT